ncbi:hypothetical protein FHS30_003143 [Simiduia aestuariiviva]|uniref:Uncharacterized protein n=1 Tax=Simiduia aestuariiviva TaxID=1510459 RepID=A0A839UU11_9GAMM|nr:hypothetical protein [Simiduia aestuariiviva]
MGSNDAVVAASCHDAERYPLPVAPLKSCFKSTLYIHKRWFGVIFETILR